MGGRPRGSPNRIKADLAQMIMNNAARAGFMQVGEDGKRIGTGTDGCDGYLLWCALNEAEILDDGENPDPYGMHDVTPNGTGK